MARRPSQGCAVTLGMSTGEASPCSTRQRSEPVSLDIRTANWVRRFFSRPNRVSTAFWAGGAVAIVSVLPLRGWSHRSLFTLAVVAIACGIVCGIRLAADRRLPRWVLYVDIGVAMVLASVLATIGNTNDLDFADLYVWVTLFAALYFRPLAVLGTIVGIGVAYALVLIVGPSVAHPAATWMALFGTVSVAGAVVFGLTRVLRSSARTDALTGLANRHMWDERLDAEIERSSRSGAALSVVMIDLDGFKAVNDSGGHEAGDRLLQDLARVWQQVVRGGDFLARLGGDEFGLLAPGSDEIRARSLAKRLRAAMPQGTAASMGVATWDGAEPSSALVRRADRAMYRDKRRRRRGA